MARDEKLVSAAEGRDRAALKRVLARFLERLQNGEAVEAEVRSIIDELKAKRGAKN